MGIQWLLLLVGAAASCCLADISGPIPIQAPAPGWALGQAPNELPRPATVVFEVMLDLACPDSYAAWMDLKQLRQTYGAGDLAILIHIYELPYHRNAWVLSKGFSFVRERKPEKLIPYVDLVYANLPLFSTANTISLNDKQVKLNLANLTTQLGISGVEFVSNVDSYETDVRESWKYAARRGVAGTPWYFVNGVDLALNANSRVNFNSWKTFIDGLLGTSSYSSRRLFEEEN